MSDLAHVLDRDVATFVTSSSSSSSGSDGNFEKKLELATEFEETFQLRTFHNKLTLIAELFKKDSKYFIPKHILGEEKTEEEESDLDIAQQQAQYKNETKDEMIDFWGYTNFELYGENERDLDDIERVVDELENYRNYIESLETFSLSKLDGDTKENAIDLLEDMIESNDCDEILQRVGINTETHIDENVVDAELCKRLVHLLREMLHMRFHTRRPEMLSRIASNMKPSLSFLPLNNKQPVWAIATSTDGTIIATAGASGEIKIWIRAAYYLSHHENEEDDEDDEHVSVCADDMDIVEWSPNVCKDVDMWRCVSSQRLIHSHGDWEDHQMLADSYVFIVPSV